VGTAVLGCPATQSYRAANVIRDVNRQDQLWLPPSTYVLSGSSATPSPYLFVNYSESVGSRVFVRKTLGIKVLSPRRMDRVSPRANFMMFEGCGGVQGKMSHGGRGKVVVGKPGNVPVVYSISLPVFLSQVTE